MNTLGKEVKREVREYYTCERCKVDSLQDQKWVPCPRGSCEAKVTGTETTITYLNKTFPKCT